VFHGFNLRLDFSQDALYQQGLAINREHRTKVRQALQSFRTPSGALSASKIAQDWFPQIDAHIFLSHSHADERTALTLAGWLERHFDLKTFVDSTVWGYSDELLREIDNEYCYQASTNTYAYEKRNRSTSHVHMMLAVALGQMLDNTECLIFLNSPTSIAVRDSIGDGLTPTTPSPWIYYELALTSLLRGKSREVHRDRNKLAKSRLNEELRIEYDVNIAHLSQLSRDELNLWQRLAGDQLNSSPGRALDALYRMMGILKEYP